MERPTRSGLAASSSLSKAIRTGTRWTTLIQLPVAFCAGITAKAGMEQPLYYWDPVIAPSGMTFYAGTMFPDWQGSLLIGGLASQALVRLTLDGTKVTGEARYFEGQGRVRDVDVAQDGAVMILSDARNGALIRITPAE